MAEVGRDLWRFV